MRRRDVGRHRHGLAFGFARSLRPDPSRRSGLASRQARVDAALEPAPAGRGLEGFPPPGPWRDNRRATRPWRRPRPSRPTAGSARKRLRARTGNGPDPKCEARNQKRRGAGPCRIRRSGSEPCLPIRFARTTRARGHRDTRPALPSSGITRKPLFDSATALPASPAGDFARLTPSSSVPGCPCRQEAPGPRPRGRSRPGP